MRHPYQRVATFFAGAVLCASAQWLNYPAPGTPRTRDGKANLSAAAPRAANGRPDLSGVWQTEPAPPGENERVFGPAIKDFSVPGDDLRTFSRYSFNILADFKPADAPLRPEAAEQFRKIAAQTTAPPICLPMGLPFADVFNFLPFKIIQTPGVIVVLYEADDTYRQIYTDGRKLPVDPQPAWLGYSVGTWKNGTLVVDAGGFNARGKLDILGHQHSEDLRIQENFHRRDFGHLDVSITLDDPKTFLRPFTVKVTELLVPDSDILETVCNENEKDRPHLGKP